MIQKYYTSLQICKKNQVTYSESICVHRCGKVLDVNVVGNCWLLRTIYSCLMCDFL